MENIRYPKYRSQNTVSHKYEQHLSPFGRKVMAALFKLKDESNNKSCKPLCPQVQPRYQNKRVLQFNDSSSKTTFIYKQAYTCDLVIDNSPPISTCLLNTPKDYSNSKDKDIKTNFADNYSSRAFQTLHKLHSNANNIQNNDDLVNLGFNQIFDINDIFGCVDDNDLNTNTENQLDVEEFILNKDAPEKTIMNDRDKDVNCNTENVIISKETVKRKNINVQCVKQKKSKIKDTIFAKDSFKKEKYTTKVKKWLNDVHAKKKGKGDQNVDKLPSNVIKAFQSKAQKNKNVVQAQLANKDGIMKYSIPNDFEINEAFKKNKKESKDLTTKSTVLKKSVMNIVTKEKETRSKFIAPIKSQIPVKDIKYPIKVINSNYIEFENKFKAVKNEEIVIILVFSNGFCQLNSQHTDDTCIPEAILFNVHDTFYYLKGVDPSIMIAFCRLISTNTLICFDAKMIFLYLSNNLEDALNMSVIFDTKIGGSLIRSDEPPETFSDLQKLLSLTPDYTIATECVLQRTAWYMKLLKESACKLKAMMVENDVYNLFVNIEMKILPIIADMERNGICVNVTKLKYMEGVLMHRMKEVEAECYEAAGQHFQINSTLQLRTILYDELKLDTKCSVKILETVSKGAKSTSETMLRSLSAVHPLPRLILEYRHLHKARATFVTGIAQHVRDGVVKPTWDQTAAVTGRIASNGPNLQAIPKTPFDLVSFPKEGESESPKLKFRSVYTSRAGYCLLAADFKHLECRVFAGAARDRVLQDALLTRDLFSELAAQWLCKSVGSVSSEDRSLTKRLVYASLYGAGARTLRHVLQGTDGQLMGIIDSFNQTFPSLKSFGKSVVSKCESRGGRLTTPSGRTRIFKNIFSTDFALRSQAERRAVNFIIQGTAADLCKRAMVLVHEQLGSRGRLLLQLHDELVWEVRRHRLHATAAIIKSAMESCGREFGLALTLPVAMYCGDNWGEMEEFTPCDEDSTAADLCKRAMVLVHEQLGSRGRLLLQLHDELVWEVRRHRLHATAAIIKSAMESCGREFGLALTLPVAMYCGDNWGEMEEFTPCDEDSS